MWTSHWIVDNSVDILDNSIQQAAGLIRAGEIVAFPTETVYGLGADARNAEAVDKIFKAKGRPSDNPLIVHIARIEQLNEFVTEYTELATKLMSHFWPGPLTIVLPLRPGALSQAVTAGLSTVAVRMPDHPIALKLIAAANCPIAAPSANRSGKPSPTKASHVRDDLYGLIAGVIDGGSTGVGLESTVVELIGESVNILRPGGISMTQLCKIVSSVTMDPSIQKAGDLVPRSPGMKYAHYAPEGQLIIVKGNKEAEVMEWIQRKIDEAKENGEKTGILTYHERRNYYQADVVLSCGSLEDETSIARELYDVLRKFDEHQVTYILAEAVSEDGLGQAIMNRLSKAASHRIAFV